MTFSSKLKPKDKCTFYLCAFLNRGTQPLICPAHCPPHALYLSAIRQIVAGLICIMSANVPIGAPHSCLLKDSGATAPSHSPIPWIKLTLGQHQHIMNYGHLPLQTHCSLCSSVKNIEGPGELSPLTAYSLSYLLWCVRACKKWTVGLHRDVRVWIILQAWVAFPVSWPLPRIQIFQLEWGLLVLYWWKTKTKIKTFTRVIRPWSKLFFKISSDNICLISWFALNGTENTPPPPCFTCDLMKKKELIQIHNPTRTPACIWLPPIIQSAKTQKKQNLK